MPDTIEERLRKLRAQQSKRPIEERLAALRSQQPPAAQPPGNVENVGIGAGRGALKYIVDPLLAIAEGWVSPQSSAQSGELAARGAKQLISQYVDPTGQLAAEQAPAIQAGQRKLAESRAGAFGFRQSKAAQDYLNARAGLDPSLTGKITRGGAEVITGALPAVATGAYGGVPMAAGVAALQSAGQPETAAFNVGASVALPAVGSQLVGPAFRTGINAVRRAFGKGAAQIVEAEALPAATAQVRQSIGDIPPTPGEITPGPQVSPGNASPTVQRAMRQFEEEVARIKTLPPGEQAAAMETAIQSIGREASGIRPVSEATRRGYPPQMVMPENPNPIQQAGRLPFEAETPLPAPEAELGVSAAPSVSARGASASVRGPAAESAALEVAGGAGQPPRPPFFSPDDPWDPRWGRDPRPAPLFPEPPTEFTGAGFDRPPVPQQLFDAAARSKWQDTVMAYLRGNWLTNPVSRASDLGNTIINQFADAVARPVAAAVDRILLSPGTKARSITGLSLRGTGQAFKSIPRGLRDAREVLRTGRQVIDSGADDVLYGSEVRSGLGKVFDVPVNGVFRLLGALDAPFRRFGYVRNLYDRAKVGAINEMKRGKVPREQISARINELMDKPDIIKAAVRDGERAVLSESNQFSAKVAELTRNSPNARLAVGIIQPFLRIPANAAMKAADFAGVGGVKALYKVARGVGRKYKGGTFFRDLEDQRVFAQNVAAGSFAPAAFMLGMELEQRGKLEGFYYTSGKDYPNGKVPTSVNIGGKNYDVNRLGGFIFAPLFVGATYSRLRKKDAGKANAMLSAFSGLAQQAPGLGYYGAVPKGMRILTAEKKGEEVAKQAGDIASGFIPASGLVRSAAKAFDLLPQKGPRSPFIDATLEQSRPLFTELQRRGKRISELRKKDGEKDDAFQQRVQQFGQNYTQYGLKLLESPRFKAASYDIQNIALDSLNNRAKGVTHRELAPYQIESILDANTIMDAAESSKKNPANK